LVVWKLSHAFGGCALIDVPAQQGCASTLPIVSPNIPSLNLYRSQLHSTVILRVLLHFVIRLFIFLFFPLNLRIPRPVLANNYTSNFLPHSITSEKKYQVEHETRERETASLKNKKNSRSKMQGYSFAPPTGPPREGQKSIFFPNPGIR
jgi:hypothetical protein